MGRGRVTPGITDHAGQELHLDRPGLWVLPGRAAFGYSDGRISERYLEAVLSRATDLSSDSYELEQWIKDWPSEYHLSRQRAQLLRDFVFKRESRVLEVGCGCGAITRFLGETFHEVVAVEGSLARARLARLRTRGQDNVVVVCSPFQEVAFATPFDVVFCVGVLEYASQFVNAADPYDATLEYFSSVLSPDGMLVLAIENQFGAKYWASSREDHTGVMFDGLEGYPRLRQGGRTFGYHELQQRVERHFPHVRFYFPFPDYKMPSCILSEEFLRRVNAGELAGRFRSRDYTGSRHRLFDERHLLLELDRNDMLAFFANAFLIVAAKSPHAATGLRSLGVLYSRKRVPSLATITRFLEDGDGQVRVAKTVASGQEAVEAGPLRLRPNATRWIRGPSLQTQVVGRSKERGVSLDALLAPCRAWLEALRARAHPEDGRLLVDGALLDCNWSNSYIVNGQCVFVDQEWEWREQLGLSVLLIRNAYHLIEELDDLSDVVPPLRGIARRPIITRIARALGVRITTRDFAEFARLEARILQVVFGQGYRKAWLLTWLSLECHWLRVWLRYGKRAIAVARRVSDRIGNRLSA
jgi:SAM-dependent methyltransferase